MTTEQANITEAEVEVAAEAARVAVQAMATASIENNQMAQIVAPKLGRFNHKEPTFNWSSTWKYAELRNFKMKVKICYKT